MGALRGVVCSQWGGIKYISTGGCFVVPGFGSGCFSACWVAPLVSGGCWDLDREGLG